MRTSLPDLPPTNSMVELSLEDSEETQVKDLPALKYASSTIVCCDDELPQTLQTTEACEKPR